MDLWQQGLGTKTFLYVWENRVMPRLMQFVDSSSSEFYWDYKDSTSDLTFKWITLIWRLLSLLRLHVICVMRFRMNLILKVLRIDLFVSNSEWLRRFLQFKTMLFCEWVCSSPSVSKFHRGFSLTKWIDGFLLSNMTQSASPTGSYEDNLLGSRFRVGSCRLLLAYEHFPLLTHTYHKS